MAIQAVLWDFGGVVTTSPFEAFNRFEAEQGLPVDFIRGINATNPDSNAWARFEASKVPLEEFDKLFLAESTAAGHPLPGSEVVKLLSGNVRPRMVEVLKRCKQDFKISCLTNNVRSGKGPGMSRSPENAAQVKAAMSLFDHVLQSSKEGMRKPQPEFYLLACERMEVEPAEVVYLDDLGINLKPARQLGMTTIKVLSEEQAINDLSEVLQINFV
ncbi:MAG: HAD family hydrolase [Gammaproteobacteria bacterium]|nr:MAG: HAD family hydrolase [Gammaproteobacteria bacterium]